MTLRLSLLFKEVHNKIGSEVRVRIGDVVPYEALASITDRAAFMQHLRDLTYALGAGVTNPPKPRIKRPRRAPNMAAVLARRGRAMSQRRKAAEGRRLRCARFLCYYPSGASAIMIRPLGKYEMNSKNDSQLPLKRVDP